MPTRRHPLLPAATGPASSGMKSQVPAQPLAGTYTNPVYAGQFPDPFVLRHGGRYYAFGTTGEGRTPDGRIFTLLTSDNLVNWTSLGGALVPPAGADGANFWAPEVVHHQGTFYMYYSMGGGALAATVGHRLHVATSPKPEGPYQQVAVLEVADCKFAIDPHPYQDSDGQWYLFFARDFTDSNYGYRPGTGLAVDRLEHMTRLAGESRTVMRARHDWTVFEKNRTMPLYDNKTFPEWHTLEGPCVRRHRGKYYCFYSGGNFLTPRYGVDYCEASSIWGPYSDAGAATGPRVLHAVDGHVRGPGHHCHVLAPNGKTEYLAYHAWNPAMTERQLCLDKLAWTDQGPRCAGPTYTPQPLPE